MLHSKLSKADFTGATLLVTTARNSSLSGISGIVIEETASTFRLVTRESTVKVIPKNGTQFSITFPAHAPPLPSLDEGEEDGQYQSTIIPLSGSTMEDYLNTAPRINVPLLGTNFGFRSGDRAGRKFRPTQGGGGGSGWGETWVKGEWSEVLGLLDHVDVEGRETSGKGAKRGESGVPVKRKRGKSRRKDPPAFGALEVS
jgi:ribonuclease P protein subunit POP4